MGWVFGTIAVTLGILAVWGLLSPRSQWRVLHSWAAADPHRSEPGGAAYAFLRLGSALGVLGLGVVGVMAAVAAMQNLPDPPAPPSAVERMWGKPVPQLLNRVFLNTATPPEGLAEAPVLGYQTFDDGIDNYLLDIPRYTRLGDPEPPGLIGTDPVEGTSALGSSNLLLHVRAPILCIPRAVLVVETEESVQVAVYYGLPDDPAGAPIDHRAACAAGDPLTGSMLIPVQLSGPVLDRTVIDLAGNEIPFVETVG